MPCRLGALQPRNIIQPIQTSLGTLDPSPSPAAIYGLVFQTESGQLREVCRDEGAAAEPAAP